MNPDEADIANDYLEHMIDNAVKTAHNKAKTELNTTGKCLWCDEPVNDTRRWCSADCRDEFAKHAKEE